GLDTFRLDCGREIPAPVLDPEAGPVLPTGFTLFEGERGLPAGLVRYHYDDLPRLFREDLEVRDLPAVLRRLGVRDPEAAEDLLDHHALRWIRGIGVLGQSRHGFAPWARAPPNHASGAI